MEGEVLAVEGEAMDGIRRSSRNLGKKRPRYAVEAVVEKVVVSRKKQKPSPRVSVVSVSEEIVSDKKQTASPKKVVCRPPLLASEPEECISPGVENGSSVGDAGDRSGNVSGGEGASTDSEIVDIRSSEEACNVPLLTMGDNDGQTGAAPEKTYRQRVKETLRLFNTYYLQAIQDEENRVRELGKKPSTSSDYKKMSNKAKKSVSNSCGRRSPKKMKNEVDAMGDSKRGSKRPDLKAISKMIENNEILHPVKRPGDLPGIIAGDRFYSRAEMCALGVHSHWLNGIDYMGKEYAKMAEYKNYTFPLAVCIVMSGMYEDDHDNSHIVTYTGQGGHDLLGSKRQVCDQKMQRGNLALKNNSISGAPVRVVRGHTLKSSYCGKVYTYDGLYKVIKYWAEKGVSGYTVFKYQLQRVDGQPVMTTNQVRFTGSKAPESISELRGLVCEDISGGLENLPIPATNEVDDPPFAPKDFQYSKSVQLGKKFKLPASAAGCQCIGDCVDPKICSCARLNGGDFPYVRKDGGRLIEAKAVVFECGPNCGCNSTCINKTSQQGLRYRLEVFRTTNKGWAVRSWDTIPAGAPVCEYTGILSHTDDMESDLKNSYIFDIDCLQTMKGLDGRERRTGDVAMLSNIEDKKADPEFCIDAGRVGSVARFINHSCEPNLFVQCVLSTHHEVKLAKVMLYAADTIQPLQELCYDYGYALNSVVGPDGNVVKLPCYCGAEGCRKRLY